MLTIALASVATVLLLAWLSVSRPSLWLPLLNRQLPDGATITAAEGVRPSLSGIAWRRIELDWNGQRLRLENGHARWQVHRLRPLDARLLHVETEHLLAVQAPPDEASVTAWEPLPRFWEASWWPVLAGVAGSLQGFDLLNHSGETVLSGSLQWQQGAHSGEASLFVANTEITVSWAPELDSAAPRWTAWWHSHGSPLGPLHAEGEAQLYWDGNQLGFQIQGQLEGEATAVVSTDALAVNASGQLDLFNTVDDLLAADWTLYGHHDGLDELSIGWHCRGQAALHHTMTPAPRLDRCNLTSALGTASLLGPVALDWQPLAVRWEQPLELTLTGSSTKPLTTTQTEAQIDEPQPGARLVVASRTCVLTEACDWPLQLTIRAGQWDDLTWGAAAVEAHLHRSAANSLQLTGLEAHLTQLGQGGLTVRDLRASVPAMTLWPQGTQARLDTTPSPWHVERLDASAHISLSGEDREETELALTVRGALTDLHFTSPSQWSTRLEVALDPTWQQHDLPTFHLQQQWQQTAQRLHASGTLFTATLDALLEHQFTLAQGDAGPYTAQFAGEFDSSDWPAETDLTAALQGADGSLLPVRALHGDVRVHINGSWHDNRLHLDLTGQAEQLAGLFGQYAFADVTLAPFQLTWNDDGLHTVAPLRWQVQEFNVGVVLADLEGQLALRQNRWHLADVSGKLLGGHFHLDALSAEEGGNLRLDQLDLAAAVALMNQPDIRVNGTLQGHLPVALVDGKPVIRDGTLRNIGPGVIRYRPAPGSDFLRNNPQTAVVGDALDNFHYQRLEADVTYHADGDLLLATRLEGRNPDLEGSPPVHLNLNVEQNIPALMRSLRAGDDIGAWLERRVNAR